MFEKIKKAKNWFITHKKTSVVLFLVIAFLGYKIYQNYTNTSGQTKYILTEVKKGSIITTITGTGQVSATGQIDVQSKVSGDLVGVYVKPGQVVKAGTLLAEVDSRDARLSLESAQVAYEKLTKSADPQDLKSAQNSLSAGFNDGWNSVSATFIDYPNLIAGMDNVFYKSGGYLNNTSFTQKNDTYRSLIQKAGQSYDLAKNQYETVLQEYNSFSRTSATSSIELVINDTEKMTKMMANALKDTQSAVAYIAQAESDTSTSATTAASNVNTWLANTNSHLSNIISAQSNITNSQKTLDDLVNGADSLDIKTQQISLQKQELTYANYFIRAPLDGVIARVPASVGLPASSVTIATIVTNQKIATISLNEVDVAKIKVGEKVNLTFDAIDDLDINGEVAEIDLVGTVSQGVVNYNVKISFDTQDDRVKSGMSVNASIITSSKQDILVVPSSSIKSKGNTYYVDYFNQKYSASASKTGAVSTTAPLSKKVEIGLSDDTNTEIISGLNEGEQIVSRIINPTATAAAAPSIFGAATGNKSSETNTNALRRIGG